MWSNEVYTLWSVHKSDLKLSKLLISWKVEAHWWATLFPLKCPNKLLYNHFSTKLMLTKTLIHFVITEIQNDISFKFIHIYVCMLIKKKSVLIIFLLLVLYCWISFHIPLLIRQYRILFKILFCVNFIMLTFQ